MNTILILLTQSKFAASIEIIALLLVAVIIGFVTAWLFAKSVDNKRIAELESEINENKKDIEKLRNEKNDLQRTFSEKDNEIRHLAREVKTLKAIHAEDVLETNDMKLKNKETEQKLLDKDEALANLKHGKHLLDYNSFGVATEGEKDNLKMISGIGPFIEERLHALDIYTFRQISKFSPRDIATIDEAIEFFSGRIERDEWIAQAKELVYNEDQRIKLLERIRARKSRIYYDRIGTATKEEADDLTEISGIGGWINEKLNALDIYTFRQISNFNEEDVRIVTEVIDYFPGRIERDEWIIQAWELVQIAGNKAELFNRISVMKNRIFYDRLGVAHKHHANNLTLIKGISLWIEERLNILEIYTFKQIRNLTATDVDILTEVLDISPGRIERDNWVSQAIELEEIYPKKSIDILD